VGDPSARLPPAVELHASRDHAAVAVLASIEQGPHEWAGVIVEREGRYAFTVPVTSGRKYSVSYVPAIPASFRIVALYHTHPCGVGDDRFSRIDVLTAVRSKLPSYIRTCRGRIYVLDPARLTNDDRRRLRNVPDGVFAGDEVRPAT
jgi:hypothetical protein